MVSAVAYGGTGSISYEWVELSTGESTMTSTWGGRNPGEYRITATDDLGESISQIIMLDSLSPIANFDVISDDLEPIDWGYIGSAPAEVNFINTSENFANPLNPFSDTTFFFKPQGFEEWMFYGNYPAIETYTFNYGGVFNSSLVVLNKNGCFDTANVTIGLFGPLSIDKNNSSNIISITSKPSSNQISIQQTELKNGTLVKIYSLNGQLIKQEEIYSNSTLIPFNGTKGIYIF